MAKTTRKRTGGRQPYSGRPTRYPNKVRENISVWLTKEGRSALAQAIARNQASMSDIFEALIRTYGPSLTMPPLPTKDQMKRLRGAKVLQGTTE